MENQIKIKFIKLIELFEDEDINEINLNKKFCIICAKVYEKLFFKL